MAQMNNHVAILMGTHNGATHLEAQLQSFCDQTHRDWSLWISDDGSTDETLALIERFRQARPDRRVEVLSGPCRGAAQNYLSLLRHSSLPSCHVALSDQDDVWLPNKLERALDEMGKAGAGPCAYAAQSIIANEDLSVRRFPTRAPAQPGFGNALVQNLFSGHTLVLNPDAVGVARSVGAPPTIVFHDWWIYQLMSGHGAHCILDDQAVVIYRQHRGNFMGASSGLSAFKRRGRLVMDGTLARWVDGHVTALWNAREHLRPQAIDLLRAWRGTQGRRGVIRARELRRLGIRRQPATNDALLQLAALLGRF